VERERTRGAVSVGWSWVVTSVGSRLKGIKDSTRRFPAADRTPPGAAINAPCRACHGGTWRRLSAALCRISSTPEIERPARAGGRASMRSRGAA
jgi:hypothetical protein